MPIINITPATKRIAEQGGLYIERDTFDLSADDSEESTADCISIGEENSDFYVAYLVTGAGLTLHSWPSYVSGLPAKVNSSIELRNVVTRLVQELIKAS